MEDKIEYCLVTGASRGIGKGFVQALLAKDKTVVACVRRPDSLRQWADSALDSKHKAKLIIIELESSDETGPWKLVEQLKTIHNIQRLDLIIANAGAASSYTKRHVADTTTEDMITTFQINTLGPMRLFQACLPLLEKSFCANFIYISSNLGSIALNTEDMWAALGYGVSKAGANYLVKSIHNQYKHIIAVAIHPGLVETDMSDVFLGEFKNAMGFSLPIPSISVEESVSGCLAVVYDATKEKTSGNFIAYDGSSLPW